MDGNNAEYEENTYKQYYFSTSDDEPTSPYPIKIRERSKSSDSLNEFFQEPPKIKKTKLHSSSVGRATNDGTSYLTTNEDDGSNATHLIKIEIFELKKLVDIPPEEHWKYADVRVKYYNKKNSKNSHHQITRKLVHSITKEISSAPNLKKYHFKKKTK